MEERKYVMVDTNDPIKLGDVLVGKFEKSFSFGHFVQEIQETLTDENVEEYIKMGVIKEDKAEDQSSENLDKYIANIADVIEKDTKETACILDRLNLYCPSAVTNLLLETISDDRYADTEIKDGIYYYINLKDGSIQQYPGIVDPFDEVPVLCASVADAAKAKEILRDQFKFLYGK